MLALQLNEPSNRRLLLSAGRTGGADISEIMIAPRNIYERNMAHLDLVH